VTALHISLTWPGGPFYPTVLVDGTWYVSKEIGNLDALAALFSGFSAGSATRVGFGLDTLTKLTPAWP